MFSLSSDFHNVLCYIGVCNTHTHTQTHTLNSDKIVLDKKA